MKRFHFSVLYLQNYAVLYIQSHRGREQCVQLARDGKLRHASPEDLDLPPQVLPHKSLARSHAAMRVKMTKNCALRWELDTDGATLVIIVHQ